MALRGRSLSGVVLDEAAFMDPEVWFEVIRPSLADKQGWALFISTPDGTASWFYDLWCYAEEAEKDWKRWQFTTIDGDNVPPAEIEAARGQLDSRTFRQEFEASFENLSGLVAINFSDANISTEIKDIPRTPPTGGSGLQRIPHVRRVRRQIPVRTLGIRRNNPHRRRHHMGFLRNLNRQIRHGAANHHLPRPNRRGP